MICYFVLLVETSEQLCLTRSPQATGGPVEGFVLPSWGFRCIQSILHTDNLSLFW